MTLNDLLNQLNDFAVLFNIGETAPDRAKRAINRSIEYYQRRLGLPVNEFTYQILYYDGNYFYTLTSDCNEVIAVEYEEKARNKKKNEYFWQPDDILIQQIGSKANLLKNYFSTSLRDGRNQVIILSKDIQASSVLLESFDNFITTTKLTAILAASTNISAISGENDKTQKTQGDASSWLKLTATTAAPVLVIPLSDITLEGLKDKEQFFGVDIYLPDITRFDKAELLYTEEGTNYTLLAKTLNADYSTRRNGWNTLKFRFRDVENFTYKNLTAVKLKITFKGLGNGVTYTLNLDNFRAYIPDYLLVTYYSNYKGKDNTGNFVLDLINLDDVPLFDTIAPDLILPICLRAAFYLSPQIKSSPEFVTIFYQEAGETLKNIGRSYPRKRTIHYGKIEFVLE